MKKLDELAAVMEPPSSPRVTLAEDDWLRVFTHLGTRLPQDFVQFHKVYGDGYLYSISHRRTANLSVFGGPSILPMVKCAPERLTQLRIQKEKRPRSVPLPLYWEPNGLLPWATTTNGTDLCWRVQGELVDNWTVVALRTASSMFEEFDVSMAVFLKGIVDGTIHCSLLPKGLPGEEGVAWEVWSYGPDSGL